MWYHDHAHGQTAATVFAGLAGFYIHSDPAHAALELPQGDYDVPLMIQDRAFNADGSFRYKLDVDRGYRGDTILVNGQIAPRMTVQRRLYRLRFLNGSNARPYDALAGQRPADGADRVRRRAAAGAGPAHVDPARARRARRGAGRLPVGRRRRAAGVAATRSARPPPRPSCASTSSAAAGARRRACPKRLVELADLPPVNATRTWPLTFQGLAGSSLADRRRGLRL